MKSLIFSAIVIIAFACTNVEKYYFVYADGEWVQVEEDPRPDNDEEKEIEDVTENSDNENIAVGDEEEDDGLIDFDDVEEENYDGDFVFVEQEDTFDVDFISNLDEETLLSDEDVFIDYCTEMKDRQGVLINGEYSDGANPGNTKTILTISLLSQTVKNNCLITLASSSIGLLNNLSFEATSTPIKKFPITCQNTDCFLYLEFFSPNTLKIRLFNVNTLDTILDSSFLRK